MKFVTVTEISAIGKGAIAGVITLGGLFQIPAIAATLTAAAHNHPHIAIAIGTITTLASLLANPQVQKVLNISVPVGSTADVNIQTPASGGTAK